MAPCRRTPTSICLDGFRCFCSESTTAFTPLWSAREAHCCRHGFGFSEPWSRSPAWVSSTPGIRKLGRSPGSVPSSCCSECWYSAGSSIAAVGPMSLACPSARRPNKVQACRRSADPQTHLRQGDRDRRDEDGEREDAQAKRKAKESDTEALKPPPDLGRA